MITPSGKRIDLNLYYTEIDGKMTQIPKNQYYELLKKRIDKLNEKIASHLLWTLFCNSGTDKEIAKKEVIYGNMPDTQKEEIFGTLAEMCKFFEKEENYQYNTFSITQSLCEGEIEKFKNIHELVSISEYLQSCKNNLQNH